jgi:DNA-directed RNA polymerase subunit beta'
MVPKIIVNGKEYFLSVGSIIQAKEGDSAEAGSVLVKLPHQSAKNVDITGGLQRVLQIFEARNISDPAILAEISGVARISPPKGKTLPLKIVGDDGSVNEHYIPVEAHLTVHNEDYVTAGEPIVDGIIDTRDVLKVLGPGQATIHIVNEVQKVYRSQGVAIADKHIEVIARKMLGMVEITDPGETHFVQGERVSRVLFLKTNDDTKGRKAVAKPIIIGITNAAQSSDSWLSSASFQRTATSLANAAIMRKTDFVSGPKENIILGGIVPLGTGHPDAGDDYLRKRGSF